MKLSFAPLLLLSAAEAFVPGWTSAVNRRPIAFQPTNYEISDKDSSPALVVLFAKKKVNAKLAALEALEGQADALEAPLSKKEIKELEKKKLKEEKAAAAAQTNTEAPPVGGKKNAKAAALAALDSLDDELEQPLSKKEELALQKKEKEQTNGESEASSIAQEEKKPKLSAKEEKLRKLMELEAIEATIDAAAPADEQPTLSKKELKVLKQKEEKMAAKMAAKAEKKAQRASELEEAVSEEDEPLNGESGDAQVEVVATGPTLEDKIRKERPPPRVRVMESAQPGYVSLRLEKVGITFRNQEVLRDVTWGVQSGDRIG